jgi:osmotically-inducible protein OsmY
MNKRWAMLGGLGLGAGLMYILDPVAGRKRRRTVADTAGSLRKRTSGSAIGRVSRDIGKEAWGLLTEAQNVFEGGPTEDDGSLADRVRERLARTVSRPEALQVTVENGVVTLAGTVGAAEFDRLVSGVLRVKGVQDVNDQLDVRPVANGARDFEDTPSD